GENMVTPDTFRAALAHIRARGGLPSRGDRYVVAIGRASPSVIYALSANPTRGTLLGAYGDFTPVRPGKVVACLLKHPGPALEKLLRGASTLAQLKQRAPDGMVAVGLKDGGVGLTDFKAYKDRSEDGPDIADAVQSAQKEILS